MLRLAILLAILAAFIFAGYWLVKGAIALGSLTWDGICWLGGQWLWLLGAALLAPPGEIMHKWIPAALAGNEQIRELAIQSAFAAGADSLLLAKAFEHEFASKKNPEPATEQ